MNSNTLERVTPVTEKNRSYLPAIDFTSFGNLQYPARTVQEWLDTRTTCSNVSKERMEDLYADYKSCLTKGSTLILKRKMFAYLLKQILQKEIVLTKVFFSYKGESTVYGLTLQSNDTA